LFHEPDYEATRYTCSPERLAGADPGGRRARNRPASPDRAGPGQV